MSEKEFIYIYIRIICIESVCVRERGERRERREREERARKINKV